MIYTILWKDNRVWDRSIKTTRKNFHIAAKLNVRKK